MEEIEKNEYYHINVDKSKNRIYLKVIGFWESPNVVPNYITDLEKASKALSRGFTIIADLRDMKTPPQELRSVHEKAQEVLVQAGLDRTAEILSSALLASATEMYAEKSWMKKREFSSIKEAEEWLDS